MFLSQGEQLDRDHENWVCKKIHDYLLERAKDLEHNEKEWVEAAKNADFRDKESLYSQADRYKFAAQELKLQATRILDKEWNK